MLLYCIGYHSLDQINLIKGVQRKFVTTAINIPRKYRAKCILDKINIGQNYSNDCEV